MPKSSYRQIVKATGILGGVQVVTALIGIVKSKFVAVLLGPEGIGINTLLTSTIMMISSISNFGLQGSAVREVADASDDKIKVGKIVSIVRRLVRWTGVIGLVATLLLSSFLSELVFKDNSYTIVFIWLSVTLLFDQLTSGELVILQGLRKLNYLAKSNVIGSLLGLLISVPVYYIWGVKGIPAAIIVSSLCLLIRTWYYSRRVEVQRVPITYTEVYKEGKGMIQLGFTLALTGFIGLGTLYLIRLYLSRVGGVDTVGLYNAGFVIVETYVGMIFTAMATDYFPRLSAVNKDKEACNHLVNEQGEITLIVLFPILAIFTAFLYPLILLLYSNSFLPIIPMMEWAILGVLLKAITFPIGYLYIAKEDKIIFLVKELFSWGYVLVASILGFQFWGIEGLGIGYLVAYFLCLVQSVILSRILYGIRLSSPFLRLSIVVILVSILNFLISRNHLGWYGYLFSFAIVCGSVVFSYIELNKRIDIKSIIKHKIFRK